MTNFEYLKQANLEQMAMYLCGLIQRVDSDEHPCDICPVTNHCWANHNGFADALNFDYLEELQ